MTTPDSLQRLDRTHVDNVPRDELFRLLEPLVVDEEVAGQTGEYVLVPDTEKLPFQMRILFDEVRKRMPEAAYVTLRTRNLITLLYIAPKLHDGAGQSFSSGVTPTTSGPKRNIAPSPITAEAVRPATSKAGELPKDQPIVLAASYQCVGSNSTTRLFRTEEQDVPTFSGGLMGGMLTESLFLRKGTSFILVEQGGQLILRKWGNERDTMIIDPNCELEVYVPENSEK